MTDTKPHTLTVQTSLSPAGMLEQAALLRGVADDLPSATHAQTLESTADAWERLAALELCRMRDIVAQPVTVEGIAAQLARGIAAHMDRKGMNARGLTQGMAQLLGKREDSMQTSVHRWLRGAYPPLGAKTLAALCTVFGCSLLELLAAGEKTNPE